jgi:UbiD family decarboxylase
MKDLATFFEEYSRAFPDEIIVIDKPVDTKWFATAVATKVERAFKIVPTLILTKPKLPNGKISPVPSVVNLLSSRKRLAWTIRSRSSRRAAR